MAEHGFLVLSDITGYTQFLTESELEHAHDILRELLKALIASTKPPLTISKLEGDAVFSYAPQSDFVNGQTLIHAIENMYHDFRLALRRMRLNTTCTCTACSNIPNLDLKFFVHYGEYMLQDLGTFTELLGTDVNLVHRLTKNTVSEALSLKAYAMYTDSALTALRLDLLKTVLTKHRDTYEHIGEVLTYIQNMHVVWQNAAEERRIVVDPSEAFLIFEDDLAYQREQVWEIFSDVKYRTLIWNSDQEAATLTDLGVLDVGATYHCYHGQVHIDDTIVDWKPFDYFTLAREKMDGDSVMHVTIRFEAVSVSRTHLAVLLASPRRPDGSIDEEQQAFFADFLDNWPGFDTARSLLTKVFDSTTLTVVRRPPLTEGDIESAISESLVALGPGL